MWCWGGNERYFHALFHIWHIANGPAACMERCPVPWALLPEGSGAQLLSVPWISLTSPSLLKAKCINTVFQWHF